MSKEEFEKIINPLALLPNKDHRKLLKAAMIANYEKWAAKQLNK